MQFITINGTDFNIEVGTLSLKAFKNEFAESFCKGKTDAEITAVHKQLKALAYGNTANNKKKSA